MLTLSLVLMLGAVPTPGQVVLDRLNEPRSAMLVLAQAADPDEVRALEKDMDRAHHHGEYRDAYERYEQPRSDGNGNCNCSAAPRQSKRPQALADGHGKAHYLVWGVVDWSITGAMWVGSLLSAVISTNAFYLGSRTQAQWNDLFNEPAEKGVRRDLRFAGVIFAGAAVGLATGGTLLSVKARRNVRVYRELRDQERVFPGVH